MSERFYQGHQGEKKPADVAFLEKWKNLDVIQGGAGLAMLFYPPTAALGLGLLAMAPVEYVVKNRYVNWRMNRRNSQNRSFAPQAA